MRKRLTAFASSFALAAGLSCAAASAGLNGCTFSADATQPEAGAATQPEAGATAKPEAGASTKAETSLLDRSKWEARMSLPTSEQVSTYQSPSKSPYIVCWPRFSQTPGYTEYAVDFRADSQPRGTYVNIGTWWMDMSGLTDRGYSVDSDDGLPGSAYAGFQVLEDGRKVAIMSFWKLFLTDADGNNLELNAKLTYPEDPSIAGEFGGEGTGVHALVDYDWQAGTTYRALIQCSESSEGHCEVTFSCCDLESGEWTKLIAYDLGYGDTYMTRVGCFLENYLTEYAADVRTVEWSNYRVKACGTDSWVSAKSAVMERQFKDWKGSYNFGSSDSCFWAITTSVPGLCDDPPADRSEFSVSNVAEGLPQ